MLLRARALVVGGRPVVVAVVVVALHAVGRARRALAIPHRRKLRELAEERRQPLLLRHRRQVLDQRARGGAHAVDRRVRRERRRQHRRRVALEPVPVEQHGKARLLRRPVGQELRQRVDHLRHEGDAVEHGDVAAHRGEEAAVELRQPAKGLADGLAVHGNLLRLGHGLGDGDDLGQVLLRRGRLPLQPAVGVAHLLGKQIRVVDRLHDVPNPAAHRSKVAHGNLHEMAEDFDGLPVLGGEVAGVAPRALVLVRGVGVVALVVAALAVAEAVGRPAPVQRVLLVVGGHVGEVAVPGLLLLELVREHRMVGIVVVHGVGIRRGTFGLLQREWHLEWY